MLELTDALAGWYFFVNDDMLISIPLWKESSTNNVPQPWTCVLAKVKIMNMWHNWIGGSLESFT